MYNKRRRLKNPCDSGKDPIAGIFLLKVVFIVLIQIITYVSKNSPTLSIAGGGMNCNAALIDFCKSILYNEINNQTYVLDNE